MIKNFCFIFILFCSTTALYAQDSLSVVDKVCNDFSATVLFANAGKYNPSAMSYTHQSRRTELGLSYRRQTGEAALLETGTDFYDYTFRARSYGVINKKHHIWGAASYVNRNTDNMRWNESSDYFNVYPYVIADSIGGNNLKSEKYSFTGGYSQIINKISWGIELDYWAMLEYRSVNPRPNNNTSNLVFNAGINYQLTDSYAVGGGISLRKYKQRNTLTFNSALGTPSVYHMTGLGMDASLFANDFTGCLFDGEGYGANLQIVPLGKYGLTATLRYDNFSFDKELDSKQNIVPTSIKEDKFGAEIVYQKIIGTNVLGVKVEGLLSERTGEEYKFTRNENGSFVRISSEKQYKNKVNHVELELLYQNLSRQLQWNISPYIGYFSLDESHKSSSRKMKISKIDFGLKPGITLPIKRHLLHADASFGYSSNLDSKLNLPGLTPTMSRGKIIHSNFEYLSSDSFNSALSVRFDYLLSQKDLSIFLKSSWNYSKYDTVHSHFIEILLGVSF